MPESSFDAIDANHDGVIDRQEFNKALADQSKPRQSQPNPCREPPNPRGGLDTEPDIGTTPKEAPATVKYGPPPPVRTAAELEALLAAAESRCEALAGRVEAYEAGGVVLPYAGQASHMTLQRSWLDSQTGSTVAVTDTVTQRKEFQDNTVVYTVQFSVPRGVEEVEASIKVLPVQLTKTLRSPAPPMSNTPVLRSKAPPMSPLFQPSTPSRGYHSRSPLRSRSPMWPLPDAVEAAARARQSRIITPTKRPRATASFPPGYQELRKRMESTFIALSAESGERITKERLVVAARESTGADELFAKLDANSDGYVSLPEWMGHLSEEWSVRGEGPGRVWIEDFLSGFESFRELKTAPHSREQTEANGATPNQQTVAEEEGEAGEAGLLPSHDELSEASEAPLDDAAEAEPAAASLLPGSIGVSLTRSAAPPRSRSRRQRAAEVTTLLEAGGYARVETSGASPGEKVKLGWREESGLQGSGLQGSGRAAEEASEEASEEDAKRREASIEGLRAAPMPMAISGWLWKKAGGDPDRASRSLSPVGRNWKRRWFTLEHGRLAYFERPMARKPDQSAAGSGGGTEEIPTFESGGGTALWEGELQKAKVKREGKLDIQGRHDVSKRRMVLDIRFEGRTLTVGTAPGEQTEQDTLVLEAWKRNLEKHHAWHATAAAQGE